MICLAMRLPFTDPPILRRVVGAHHDRLVARPAGAHQIKQPGYRMAEFIRREQCSSHQPAVLLFKGRRHEAPGIRRFRTEKFHSDSSVQPSCWNDLRETESLSPA